MAVSRRVRWRSAGAAVVVAVAVAVAVAWSLAGRGDGDPDRADPDPAYDGPIAEFMGWEQTGGEPQRPEFTEADRERHYRVQDLIADCMSRAGFEYTPVPFYGDRAEQFEDPYADIWQLREEDPAGFARAYGYGFTTINFGERALPTQDPADDPNRAYRDRLPPDRQAAYDRALHGDFEGGDQGGQGEPGGCSSQAYREVYGTGRNDDGEERFQELFAAWDELYQQIEADPRLTAATQAWIDCMAAAGYPGMADRYGGQQAVSRRQSELYGGQGGAAPPEPDPAALAELQQFEREIAVADYSCRQQHDLDGVEREVRYEHEERFIEAHREQLEAYRDWSNAQRAN
ncbi:MAG TPA: hypothetical protein VIL37_20165 [Natronosporangium sp.]